MPTESDGGPRLRPQDDGSRLRAVLPRRLPRPALTRTGRRTRTTTSRAGRITTAWSAPFCLTSRPAWPSSRPATSTRTSSSMTQDNVVQLKKDVPQTVLILGVGRLRQKLEPDHVRQPLLRLRRQLDLQGRAHAPGIGDGHRPESFADVYGEPRQLRQGRSRQLRGRGIRRCRRPGLGAYIDPHDEKEFGPNAKYYKFNLAEAKKLVAAAGFNNAEFDFFHNSEQTYGAGYARQVQIYSAMFCDLGLKPNQKGLPYATWLAQYHYGYIPATYNAGQTKGFTGIGLRRRATALHVRPLRLRPRPPRRRRLPRRHPDGNNAVKGDPSSASSSASCARRSDKNKVNEGMKEVQRYDGAADVLHPEALELDPVHRLVARHRQRRRVHFVAGRREPLGRAQPAVVARHHKGAVR